MNKNWWSIYSGSFFEKGIVVNREDILTILDLEMEYMVKEGIAVPIDQEG